jgi:sulfate permease, SulP family
VFRPRSKDHPEDEFYPGLLLLKTEGVIHFANAQRIGNMFWPLVREYRPRVVVMDCSAVPDLEYTALKMLIEAEKKLRQSGVSLWLAALNPEPLRLIQKSALGEALGRERMYFTLEQAVKSFLRQSRGAGL